MNIRNLVSLSLLLAATAGFAQDSVQSELKLDLLPNEAWWGGAVTLGTKMPYGAAPIDINLDGDNRGNQYAPLLVSSKGRYVWCEKAFRFAFKDKALRVTSAGNTFRYGRRDRACAMPTGTRRRAFSPPTASCRTARCSPRRSTTRGSS